MYNASNKSILAIILSLTIILADDAVYLYEL